MIPIDQGKMYIRRLSGIDSAVIGVIAVPVGIVPERLYVAMLDDQAGMHLDPIGRDLPKTAFYSGSPQHFGASEYDPASLLRIPMFRGPAVPHALEVFLRDTELPDAPPGCKWVIATGASRAHEGESRMLAFEYGDVTVTVGEQFIGDGLNGALCAPLWGNQENPCSLAYHLDLKIHDDFLKQSRAANKDKMFQEFLQEMKQNGLPEKTWYTKDELEVRTRETRRIAQGIMLKHEPWRFDASI